VSASRFNLIRVAALFSALGMLVLTGIVVLSYVTLERTRASTEEVLETRERRGALVDLLSVIQDAETGQRGYLLTNEDRYLKPYERAVKQTDERLARLAKLLQSDAQSSDFIKKLSTAIDAKLAELSETVALAKAGESAQAIALVRSDRGKQLMDHLRELLSEKRNDVEARLSDAVASQRENAAMLQWTIIAGGVLILLAGLGATWTLVRYTSEIVKARTEVELLNAGLEFRVQERTVELQRANEEIQRFAYIVSHDLRAPLVNVMGFTTEMKSSLETLAALTSDPIIDASPAAEAARAAVATEIPESIGFIQSSTKKMDSLINAILKLSREGRRTLNPEAINLDALFQGISSTVQHQLLEAEGELVINGKLPTIVSDRLALEQVFGNLVDNALKYRDRARAPRIEVRARHERDGAVLIEVEDNGRGIAEHDHERIFDLFRRAGAPDRPGEGIGLAHVRALVRRLGGQITLTSELGTGTTFRVRLPRNLRLVLEQAGELRG